MKYFKNAAVVGAIVGVAGSAIGQTITVNSADDTVDIPWTGTVADLPGPNGKISFREATIAADNTPGPQTVAFAIPQGLWHPFYPNRATIELDGPISLNSDDTTVDFSTQTDFTGDTNPNGKEVGLVYFGPPSGFSFIYIFGHRNTIRGLDQTSGNAFGASVEIAGNDNRVLGCNSGSVHLRGNFGGPAASRNTVGGAAPGDGNTLFSVEILCWANDNIVVGNRLTHVRIEGSQYCVYPTNNRLGGPTPAERNTVSGYGYYGEEGFPTGTQVSVVWAKDTLIEGNYVGTTPDGMARQPQIGPGGVGVTDSINTTIRGNLIAGLRVVGANHYAGQIFGDAISVGATNANNENVIIENNTIGLAADGVTVIPTRRGISVAPFTARQGVLNTRIGGQLPGQGNTISGVETYAVLVHSLTTGVVISGNSIRDCGSIGIELTRNSGADGPTPNDTGDADTGANGLQNYPVITSASANAGGTRVAGTFNSLAGQNFVLEFFASPACDPTGFGEGAQFLGSGTLSTDGTGNAAFDLVVPGAAAVGSVVTATARHTATGNTSEFSACFAVSNATCPADFNGDGFVTGDDFDAYVAAFEAGDAAADFNGDGFVTGDDFDAFVIAFEAGC